MPSLSPPKEKTIAKTSLQFFVLWTFLGGVIHFVDTPVIAVWFQYDRKWINLSFTVTCLLKKSVSDLWKRSKIASEDSTRWFVRSVCWNIWVIISLTVSAYLKYCELCWISFPLRLSTSLIRICVNSVYLKRHGFCQLFLMRWLWSSRLRLISCTEIATA